MGVAESVSLYLQVHNVSFSFELMQDGGLERPKPRPEGKTSASLLSIIVIILMMTIVVIIITFLKVCGQIKQTTSLEKGKGNSSTTIKNNNIYIYIEIDIFRYIDDDDNDDTSVHPSIYLFSIPSSSCTRSHRCQLDLHLVCSG